MSRCFFEEACKPVVTEESTGWLPDPLRRTALCIADKLTKPMDRTIVTIASKGFDVLLRQLVESLKRTQKYEHRLCLILLDDDEQCLAVARHYEMDVIRAKHLVKPGPGSKSGLYACPHLIESKQFLCLDADIIVYESLEHIFKQLDTAVNPVFMVRDLNEPNSLLKELTDCYKSSYDEVRRCMPGIKRRAWTGTNCNDGLFAGTKEAILKADRLMRRWAVSNWLQHPRCCWRNQGVWNLAVHSACDPIYGRDTDNVQLHVGPGVTWENNKPFFKGEPVSVIHFVGASKTRHKADQRLPE
ncbi:MAG: glycosyltransferase family 2 protein [Desulfurellales bacterium]|nr:MAG: glycosyltransferase family 2 protein [Desulfurellales bacterium]